MRFSKLSVFWGDSPSSTWSGGFAVASSEGLSSWEGQASAWTEAEGDSGDGCCGQINEMELFSRLCIGPTAEAGWLEDEAMGLVGR